MNPQGNLIYVDHRYGYIQALDLTSNMPVPSPPVGAAPNITLVVSGRAPSALERAGRAHGH